MKGFFKVRSLKKIAIISAILMIAGYAFVPAMMNSTLKTIGKMLVSYKTKQEASMPDLRSDEQKAQAVFNELLELEEAQVEKSEEWQQMVKLEKRRRALLNIQERQLLSDQAITKETIAFTKARLADEGVEVNDVGK